MKLENVLDFSFWFVWVEVEGLGERVVGQPRGLRSGCRFEVGNRDKQGSDGDDDDGGTWTRPDKSVRLITGVDFGRKTRILRSSLCF